MLPGGGIILNLDGPKSVGCPPLSGYTPARYTACLCTACQTDVAGFLVGFFKYVSVQSR